MHFSGLALLALPLANALPFGISSFQPKEAALTESDFTLLNSLFSPYTATENLVTSITNEVEAQFADPSEKTIWQLLNEDTDKYSKLIKLIEIDEKAKEVLDDREIGITFFAPENDGFPKMPHHDDDDDDEEDLALIMSEPSLHNLHTFYSRHSASLSSKGDDEDDDDEDKKMKKRIFKFILRAALKYHGLPAPYSAGDLAGNKTFETALKGKYGASDGEALRIRVDKKIVPPTLELNFYSKVVLTSSDIQAKNGYLHTIDHPLFPPPSILNAAFLFPKEFSTLTSAVQKVGGQKYLEFEVDLEKSKKKGNPVFRGSGAVTLFAPTNAAFEELPEKLIFFLFSPFGEEALTKLLAYHALPEQILFSEHYHKVHHDDDEQDVKFVAFDDNSIHEELELPTGLPGKNLKVVVDKSKLLPIPGASKTTIKVNDVEVETIDVPALNGVIHVIPEVLVPPHKHHKDDIWSNQSSGWEDWESWFVDWVESA